jgi:serine/threonine-protein kinase
MKHVREEAVPPTQLVPDIPPDLELIVMTALAKDVQTRYQTAEEMRADLMRFGRGQRVAAMPPAVQEGAPTMAATGIAAAAADPDAEIWDEQPRRYGPIIATVIGMTLLAAVIIYAVFFLGNSDDPTAAPRVEVPNVVGDTFDNAQVELEGLGFKVERRDEVNDAPIDQVTEQSPEAGLLLAKGRTVVLTVSSRQVTIPDLAGQTFEQAQAALADIGLTAERVDAEVPDTPAGTVINTDPAAGTTVDKGTVVRVAVAAEPPVAVPNVVNQDQVAAQNALQAAGFSVQLMPVADNAVAAGKVVSTNPAGGTKAPKGSTVVMNVSTGPATVAVPPVVGQPCNAGAAQLQASGFNVTVNGNPAGTVTAQNPGGGTQAAPGSGVSISCT